MLPEVDHGVIPDTGGVARLFQICGHGVAADMVLTGRPMRRRRRWPRRRVARRPADELDATAREMAEKIAAAPAVTVKMARRVLAPPRRAEVRTSMAEELIAQTFITKSDDMAELRAARAEDRDAALHGELTMSDVTTCPACPSRPSPAPARCRPAPSPARGVRHRRRHRPGQGHRHRVRPARRVDRDRQPQARAPRAGHEARRRAGRAGRRRWAATSATPSRSRRLRRGRPRRSACPTCWSTTPRPTSRCRPRTCRPTRGAPSSTSRSTAPSSAPRVRPPPPRGGHAGIDRQRRRVVRVDRRPRLRPLRRGQGRREEHGRDARRRVGALRHPGERARAGPVPPRGHDRRHPGQPRPHLGEGRRAAGAARRAARELGWAATFLASPYARFISGHTLVVDGANWQRRCSPTRPS